MPKLLIQIYLFPLIIKNLHAWISEIRLQPLISHILKPEYIELHFDFLELYFCKGKSVSHTYTHTHLHMHSLVVLAIGPLSNYFTVPQFLYLEMEITELASWSCDKDQVKWYRCRARDIAGIQKAGYTWNYSYYNGYGAALSRSQKLVCWQLMTHRRFHGNSSPLHQEAASPEFICLPLPHHQLDQLMPRN